MPVFFPGKPDPAREPYDRVRVEADDVLLVCPECSAIVPNRTEHARKHLASHGIHV